MKNIFFLITVFHYVFMPLCSQAQLVDSISAALQKRPKLSFRFDVRNSFITAQPVRVFGIKIGHEYNNTVKIGIGYNSLLTEIIKPKQIVNENLETDTVNALLKFNYVSPYFEYVFFRNKQWEHSMLVQIGFGNSRYEYRHQGNRIRENYQPMILYEPFMTTQYRIVPWAGLGAGVGYRLQVMGNREINENFNSPIYVVKFLLFLGDLYRNIFPKKENKKEKANGNPFHPSIQSRKC